MRIFHIILFQFLYVPVILFAQDSTKNKSLLDKTGLVLPHDSIHIPKMPVQNPFIIKGLDKKKPLIKFYGGNISYQGMYRSAIDTPFAEKNIIQNQLTTSMGVSVGQLPFRLQAFVRKTNSIYFRDIADVQVAFDATAYRRNRYEDAVRKMARSYIVNDNSLAKKLFSKKELELKDIGSWLNDPLVRQKLMESYETLNVPGLHLDPNLPDSVNQDRVDSIKRSAKAFIETYNEKKEKFGLLQNETDSLRQVFTQQSNKYRQYQNYLENPLSFPLNTKKLEDSLCHFIPAKFRWLLNVRKFAVGRSSLNTSELTAKNININGFNFEYNSWFYLHAVAGVVDYRFRDFMGSAHYRSPQYLYMLRLGLGRIEKNYLIFSAFRGQKQLYTSTSPSSQVNSISISGVSVQAKWQPMKHAFAIVEAAQSFAPDFRSIPFENKTTVNWKEHSGKAYSAKMSYYNPSSFSKLEASYKYTGVNYQAFQSFQTNAATTSWAVKAEQSLLRRKIKLTASLSTNDFSNPYVLQGYKANTVFKSFSATVRQKKLPTISIGYMPMSQMTLMDGIIMEQRFQTLTASMVHTYRMGQARAASSVIYTNFLNDPADSAFLYFNSRNIFANQSFYFKGFTLNMVFSNSNGNDYNNNVIEESISFPIKKRGSVGGGIRLNQLNHTDVRIGGFASIDFPVGSNDTIGFMMEKNYLPNNKVQLVSNIIGNISFIKNIR